MAFTKESFGESLFASVGRSDRDLPATLEALGSALVAHDRLQSLAMRLDDIGTLVVERGASVSIIGMVNGPVLDRGGRIDPFRARSDDPGAHGDAREIWRPALHPLRVQGCD